MPSDFFTPSWMNAYYTALQYKNQPVVLAGVDLGREESETLMAVVKLGESGWEIVDVKDLPPRER